MTRVTFLFDNYSNSDIRQYYTVTRELDAEGSIRDAALSVVREAQINGLTEHRDYATDDAPLAIYLKSSTVQDAATGYSESGFGLRYSLNSDGAIHILHGYEPLQHDWTPRELKEMTNSGYIHGNPVEIVVALPDGLGATPQDVFDWLGFLANIYGIALPTAQLAVGLVQKIKYRKIRKIAETWSKNGIRYPAQIREFIDVKVGWKLSEVKRRLKLNDEYAIKLLTNLGLEPKQDIWQLTQSKQSIANRKKWLRNEKKYAKLLDTRRDEVIEP